MIFLTLLSGFSFFSIANVSAQGNLLITPRRVVFEKAQKSFDLNLANTGRDTATFAISLVQIRMNEDGGFETITKPDSNQWFADPYIRFFPRMVTLGPNESQVVKIQLMRSNGIAPGEYRSHFYFRSLTKVKPLGEEEDQAIDTTKISVKLNPVFGITIPVIIRVGEPSVKVNLSNLSFEHINDTIPRIKLVFNRIGNTSVYGNVIVDHIAPNNQITRVGEANGIAVYTPNTIRRFELNLTNAHEVDFKTGKLRVVFAAPSDDKPIRYAEGELLLR
jgi:hypothetical protein